VIKSQKEGKQKTFKTINKRKEETTHVRNINEDNSDMFFFFTLLSVPNEVRSHNASSSFLLYSILLLLRFDEHRNILHPTIPRRGFHSDNSHQK